MKTFSDRIGRFLLKAHRVLLGGMAVQKSTPSVFMVTIIQSKRGQVNHGHHHNQCSIPMENSDEGRVERNGDELKH